MNVVYLVASFPISNPSWIVDTIHKILQSRNMMSSFMLVATVIFWGDYLALLSSLFNNSLPWGLQHLIVTLVKEYNFFIMLGQCFISYVCGWFTICKWYLNITYPKRALVIRITFPFIFNASPPSLNREVTELELEIIGIWVS